MRSVKVTVGGFARVLEKSGKFLNLGLTQHR
jgi:hypothetical protein